jgi:hypothetical protein
MGGNPKLTVRAFLAVMEGDFARDFSKQAREEWRCVKLVKNGPNLTVKDWRSIQLQFDVAADRLEDKGIGRSITYFMANSRPFGKRRS